MLDPKGRKTKTPARLTHSSAEEHTDERTTDEECRREYYEAIDFIGAEIDRRVDQSSMCVAVGREEALLKSSAGAAVFIH